MSDERRELIKKREEAEANAKSCQEVIEIALAMLELIAENKGYSHVERTTQVKMVIDLLRKDPFRRSPGWIPF